MNLTAFFLNYQFRIPIVILSTVTFVVITVDESDTSLLLVHLPQCVLIVDIVDIQSLKIWYAAM